MSVAQGEHSEGHAPAQAHVARADDLRLHGDGVANGTVSDGREGAAILIGAGIVREHVAQGADAELGQQIGALGADAGEGVDGVVEIHGAS